MRNAERGRGHFFIDEGQTVCNVISPYVFQVDAIVN